MFQVTEPAPFWGGGELSREVGTMSVTYISAIPSKLQGPSEMRVNGLKAHSQLISTTEAPSSYGEK